MLKVLYKYQVLLFCPLRGKTTAVFALSSSGCKQDGSLFLKLTMVVWFSFFQGEDGFPGFKGDMGIKGDRVSVLATWQTDWLTQPSSRGSCQGCNPLAVLLKKKEVNLLWPRRAMNPRRFQNCCRVRAHIWQAGGPRLNLQRLQLEGSHMEDLMWKTPNLISSWRATARPRQQNWPRWTKGLILSKAASYV